MDPPQAPVSSFQVASDRNQVQVVVGTIAAGWDDPPNSDTTSNVDEEEETGEYVDASIPMDQIIESRKASLKLRIEDPSNPNQTAVKLVLEPTAAKIHYTALHPAIYRFVEPLSEIEQLAERLNVHGWQAECDRIWPAVEVYFTALVSLGKNESEKTISFALRNVIRKILQELNREWLDDARTCATVRGTLAHDQYEVRGVADQVISSCGEFILAVEVKTAQSWPDSDWWYLKSRGVQILNALYACHCPALLVTQSQFKIFLESEDRTRISTYPAKPAAPGAKLHDRFMASVGWQASADILFDVLVICLMKAKHKVAAVRKRKRRVAPVQDGNSLGQSTNEAPQKPAGATHQTHSSPTVDRGQGSRALGEPAEAAEPAEDAEPTARFYTGVDDQHGNPIYQLIYVSRPQAPDFASDEFSSDGFE